MKRISQNIIAPPHSLVQIEKRNKFTSDLLILSVTGRWQRNLHNVKSNFPSLNWFINLWFPNSGATVWNLFYPVIKRRWGEDKRGCTSFSEIYRWETSIVHKSITRASWATPSYTRWILIIYFAPSSCTLNSDGIETDSEKLLCIADRNLNAFRFPVDGIKIWSTTYSW